MPKLTLIAGLTFIALSAPAFAADPALGEADFKKCKACHSIIAADGTEIVKGGKTGPNLWGVIGRQVGSAPDYTYGEAMLAVGAAGAVWDEASLAAYIADPSAWLEGKDGRCRGQVQDVVQAGQGRRRYGRLSCNAEVNRPGTQAGAAAPTCPGFLRRKFPYGGLRLLHGLRRSALPPAFTRFLGPASKSDIAATDGCQ